MSKSSTEEQRERTESPCLPLEVDYAKKLQGILEISNLVGSVLELTEILARITAITSKLLEVPVCSIFLVAQDEPVLVLRATHGLDPKILNKARLNIGEGLPGIAAQDNDVIVVENVGEDARHKPILGGWGNNDYGYICVPLRIQDEVIGVMTARRAKEYPFRPQEVTLFETICKQVSIVIEKSRMYFEKREADRIAAISISLSEVAHYIKNLLQGMKGGSYFVDQGLKRGDIETARKGWDVLRRGNRKITSLTENMLNYTREEEMRFETHNINGLIYDILGQIDDASVERGVALLPETERNLPAIEISYDKIYDVILNLITNAIDAIPADKEDGLVIVRSHLSEDREWVEVIVQDNGSGIPEEARAKVFNLFFSTKGGQGTGIGLAVSRKIVEKHGGSIDFKTEIDKGTTFTIRLPIDRERHATAL